MEVTWLLVFLCWLSCDLLCHHGNMVVADECGTRFTDFTSSAVLAQVVLKGSIKEFNPPSLHSQVHSANVTVKKVYKGMDVLKEFNRSVEEGDNVVVNHFGSENMDDCVALDDEESKGRDKVFFLRQTSHRGMLRLSAMPVDAPSSVDRRVRRSLCSTCVRRPTIKRLVCHDCAVEPTIRTMKSKKAKLGRRARLKCSARGKPSPTISWTKADVPIVSGMGGITVRTTGPSSLLIFTQVTQAHSGRYKCIATNLAGATEDFVTLNITSRGRRRQRHPDESVETFPCEESTYCLNGGSCIFSPTFNLRTCICSPGYAGVRCELIDSSSQTGDNEPNGQDLNQVPVAPPSETTTRNDANENQPHTTPTTTISTTSTTSTTTSTTSTTTATTTSRRVFIPRQRGSVLAGEIDPRFPLKKKSSLKTIPCFEKNYCLNKGKCRLIRKLNKKFCKCRIGYMGNRCERKIIFV